MINQNTAVILNETVCDVKGTASIACMEREKLEAKQQN